MKIADMTPYPIGDKLDFPNGDFTDQMTWDFFGVLCVDDDGDLEHHGLWGHKQMDLEEAVEMILSKTDKICYLIGAAKDVDGTGPQVEFFRAQPAVEPAPA